MSDPIFWVCLVVFCWAAFVAYWQGWGRRDYGYPVSYSDFMVEDIGGGCRLVSGPSPGKVELMARMVEAGLLDEVRAELTT